MITEQEGEVVVGLVDVELAVLTGIVVGPFGQKYVILLSLPVVVRTGPVLLPHPQAGPPVYEVPFTTPEVGVTNEQGGGVIVAVVVFQPVDVPLPIGGGVPSSPCGSLGSKPQVPEVQAVHEGPLVGGVPFSP